MEAMSNLKTLYISQMAHWAETERYATTFEELNWSPAGENRYTYYLGNDATPPSTGYPEPLPSDHPLWTRENVIITPHVAAQSAQRVPTTTRFFCQNLQRYFDAQPLVNLVDKSLGFPRPEARFRATE